MAYTPTAWSTGDTVTAEKLNNMENGIKALNTLVVKVIDNAMNRTFKQISDAYKVGHPVLILKESTNEYTQITKINATDRVIECDFGIFIATSDSDYPQLEAGNGGLVVHSVYNETTNKNVLDKTWQEIYNAVTDGKSVCIISGDIRDILTIWCDLTVGCDITLDAPDYYITCDQGSTGYTCTSPNEYPEV